MAFGPVPEPVDVKAPEQGFVALEQFPQRVQQQALAEAARAGQEVVATILDQPVNQSGLVDVVEVVLPNRAEVLYADRQPASVHGSSRLNGAPRTLSRRALAGSSPQRQPCPRCGVVRRARHPPRSRRRSTRGCAQVSEHRHAREGRIRVSVGARVQYGILDAGSLLGSGATRHVGAEERTRTSTDISPLPPQGSVSTNSTTSA